MAQSALAKASGFYVLQVVIRIGSGEGLFVYLFVETFGAKFARSFGH